jgi:hypothetical protein
MVRPRSSEEDDEAVAIDVPSVRVAEPDSGTVPPLLAATSEPAELGCECKPMPAAEADRDSEDEDAEAEAASVGWPDEI